MKRSLIALVALTASFPALADDPTGFDPAAACAPDDTECLERARAGEQTGSTGATEKSDTETAGAVEKTGTETPTGAMEQDDDLLQKQDVTFGQETAFVPSEDIYLEGGRYVVVEEQKQDQLVLHVHDAQAVRDAADGIDQANVDAKDRLEPFATKMVREAQVGIDDPEVLQALNMALDDVRPGTMQGEESRELTPAGIETEDRYGDDSQQKGIPAPGSSLQDSSFEQDAVEGTGFEAGGDPIPVHDTTGTPSTREEAGTILPGQATPHEPTDMMDDEPTDLDALEKDIEDEADSLRPTTIERDIEDTNTPTTMPDPTSPGAPVVPPPAPEIEQIEEENATDETFDDMDDVGDQAPE